MMILNSFSRRLLILAFFFSFVGSLGIHAAGVNKSGTVAGQFLKIGVGARASAMGGGYVGLANGVDALYWNPAGVAWMSNRQLMVSHSEWFAKIDHEYLAVALPFGSLGTFGISFTALSAPEMEQTTISQPEGTGIFFDVLDIAIGGTYARKLTDRFSFGITAKYVYQKLFNETASSLALDLGGYLHTGFKGMRLGMAMSNFGGKMKLDGRDLIVSYNPDPDAPGTPVTEAKLSTESWSLPTTFRVGIAINVLGKEQQGFFSNEAQRLTLTADGNQLNDAAETMNLGLEYTWYERFFLRGGYRVNHDTEDYSAGLGLKVPLQAWMIMADYALSNMNDLGYIHRMSISLQF
jgi:long-subunit fatty acid transport protein